MKNQIELSDQEREILVAGLSIGAALLFSIIKKKKITTNHTQEPINDDFTDFEIVE